MCINCEDTGMIYNEGVYGWDYGGYYPCECEIGKQVQEEQHRLYGYEMKDKDKDV